MARILVAEGDRWSRTIVFELLVLRGHDVRCATSVDDVRAQLDSVKFDAVLLAPSIPGGGGKTLLREIRKYSLVVPVIAFTASAMDGDRERLVADGFTGCISKPFDVKSFGEAVEAYLLSP